MPDTVPTVKVKDSKAPGGFVVINEEDFDEKKHTKLTAAAESKADEAIAGAATEKQEPKKQKDV